MIVICSCVLKLTWVCVHPFSNECVHWTIWCVCPALDLHVWNGYEYATLALLAHPWLGTALWLTAHPRRDCFVGLVGPSLVGDCFVAYCPSPERLKCIMRVCLCLTVLCALLGLIGPSLHRTELGIQWINNACADVIWYEFQLMHACIDIHYIACIYIYHYLHLHIWNLHLTCMWNKSMVYMLHMENKNMKSHAIIIKLANTINELKPMAWVELKPTLLIA